MGEGQTNLLEFGFRKEEKRIHEAQKPLDLIEYLIKLTTKEGQLVLDPFMGSGTTAIAAKLLNRKFIGFEANQEFFETSLKRLESITEENYIESSPLQPTLFHVENR
ncbi:MAG: hypothetical protein CVV39_07610 [Planctomycetes bacterium HGW-Planctomycetes-1]|nr:MAG: hypothetical protein CVV39_07610 [Planctomycetes bacterium HGW-Planctomycetes-1]